MNEMLSVYGFGSFFAGKAVPRDIDLLLLHRSTDRSSCQFAIDCKARIERVLPSADIVMLSRSEAERHRFVSRSKAIELGKVTTAKLDEQLATIISELTRSRSLSLTRLASHRAQGMGMPVGIRPDSLGTHPTSNDEIVFW